jgi:CDP-glucose 4,6-dehydratase
LSTAIAKGYEKALKGRRILLTGHTGFTGSWATLWLKAIGAEVAGLSLDPETEPSLFAAVGVSGGMVDERCDICDYEAVSKLVRDFRPEAIIHLAAQALVRRSYREPRSTFEANAMGTANVLEAARLCDSVRAVVCITTDKVYENREWDWPYRENDPLGGHDPYSASKAAAEMIIRGYAKSFAAPGGRLAIAVARGGNIIGGGDWSEDRLIPDFVRAVTGSGKMTIRYPEAVRPWQHVLALVQGYLMLAAGCLEEPGKYARSWNFGPSVEECLTVREVLELLGAEWSVPSIDYMSDPLPEAKMLLLDSGLARRLLGWTPAWDAREAIAKTARWYRDYYRDPARARALCEAQIEEWRSASRSGDR